MENYKVYKHTSPNGKVYIGITKNINPKTRWDNGNGYPNNKYFTNAINKYGWNNFTHEILFENLSKEEACKKEIELIAKYKSNNPEIGYNLSLGGENSYYGCKHTENSKKLIGSSHKNRIWINNGIYSKMIYEYEIDNYISQGFKIGRIPHSEQTRINIGNAIRGKKYSEEIKKSMSERLTGKPHPHKRK